MMNDTKIILENDELATPIFIGSVDERVDALSTWSSLITSIKKISELPSTQNRNSLLTGIQAEIGKTLNRITNTSAYFPINSQEKVSADICANQPVNIPAPEYTTTVDFSAFALEGKLDETVSSSKLIVKNINHSSNGKTSIAINESFYSFYKDAIDASSNQFVIAGCKIQIEEGSEQALILCKEDFEKLSTLSESVKVYIEPFTSKLDSTSKEFLDQLIQKFSGKVEESPKGDKRTYVSFKSSSIAEKFNLAVLDGLKEKKISAASAIEK